MMRRSYDSDLAARIDAINALRRGLPPGATSVRLLEAEAWLDEEVPCSRRLAVYGTLAPGGENHRLLLPLGGRWFEGWVLGARFVGRCGSATGYPALVLDPAGDRVPVAVLESRELPRRLGPIDIFEGEAYRRVIAPVWDEAGLLVIANIYEAVEGLSSRTTGT